jgi:hypothetical protein
MTIENLDLNASDEDLQAIELELETVDSELDLYCENSYEAEEFTSYDEHMSDLYGYDAERDLDFDES